MNLAEWIKKKKKAIDVIPFQLYLGQGGATYSPLLAGGHMYRETEAPGRFFIAFTCGLVRFALGVTQNYKFTMARSADREASKRRRSSFSRFTV
jgi:hypothetical protein